MEIAHISASTLRLCPRCTAAGRQAPPARASPVAGKAQRRQPAPNYNNNTTLIYEHLRHTELLRPVHPFAGNGTASQPPPALRNLVRRAAAVYSGRESFIV